MIKNLTIDNDEISDDMYKWNGLRYFLVKYEQYLQKSSQFDIQKIQIKESELPKKSNRVDLRGIEN